MSELDNRKTGGTNKMAELKMNITFGNDVENQEVHIDTDTPYTEDYQMKMMKYNKIEQLLEVSGTGMEGGSRYTFRTDGWITAERKYETGNINGKEIIGISEAVLSAVESVKNYMLHPDHILLSPELIFEKDGKYRFCYLPVRSRPLSVSFHELTEFFLKKLDYHDTEGIFLAYSLHKESMQEQYELKNILDEYRKEEKKRKEEEKSSFRENVVFSPDQDEEDCESDIYPVGASGKPAVPLREEYARYGPLKKVVNRLKTGIWGEWEDLITETDGQDEMTHL